MSAFLGPIHYWLYNKIVLQDKMTDDVFALNEKNGYVSDLENKTASVCGVIEKKPLEEMIDESNIHGWLQGKICTAESRFAYAVTQILNANQDAISELKEVLFQLGIKIADEMGETFDSAEQIYQKLNDILLDGMPCDHINQLVSKSMDEVVYHRAICIHENFWHKASGKVEVYYVLRTRFIEGFLQESAFSYFADVEGNYHITKK